MTSLIREARRRLEMSMTDPIESESLESPELPSKPKRRRRLAVSLRSLMILILIVGVWLAWQTNRARTIRRAIDTIEKSGGLVVFQSPFNASGQWKSWLHPPRWLYRKLGQEYLSDVEQVLFTSRKGEACAPEAMRALASLPRLQKLRLLNIPVSNGDMQAIGRLSDLEEIEIMEPFKLITPMPSFNGGKEPSANDPPELTIVGLRHLAGLRKLRKIELATRCPIEASILEAWSQFPEFRELHLGSDKLKDAELQSLGKFGRLQKLEFEGEILLVAPRTSHPLPIASWGELESLRIAFMDLSQDEVRAISRLAKLKSLTLFYAGLSDEKLLLLREMKGLKELYLHNNPITSEGVEALQSALPNLTIERR
jgi:hypothetical protein